METLKVHLRGFIDRYWADKLCVSKACRAEARRDGIADIRKFEPRRVRSEPTREKYHLEHYMQVDDLRDLLLKLKEPTVDEIVGLIQTSPIKKVWLLKEENDRLPRGKRPDPALALEQPGIQIFEG